jgi:uncharacterized protein YbbK (DUF523 family)
MLCGLMMNGDNDPGDSQALPRIGASSCLIGEEVRYDGACKLDPFIEDVVARHLELVPVCPETESGMPVPREPMQLEGEPDAPRLMTVHSQSDVTDRIDDWLRERLDELDEAGLSGFIFKSRSPSCGLGSTPLVSAGGNRTRGFGLFATAFRRRFPYVPMIEETELLTQDARDNFIERVFLYRRWQELVALSRCTHGELVRFHTNHKLQILAHDPIRYRHMGQLLEKGPALPIREIYIQYQELLTRAMELRATAAKHTNALHHAMGYLKRLLTRIEKQELGAAIEASKLRQLPVLVPLTLLRHHARRFHIPYLLSQTYLNPNSIELMLRFHA